MSKIYITSYKEVEYLKDAADEGRVTVSNGDSDFYCWVENHDGIHNINAYQRDLLISWGARIAPIKERPAKLGEPSSTTQVHSTD